MCLCYLFSAKSSRQLVNRKADFFLQIRIDSHNESNRIDSKRELECSNADKLLQLRVKLTVCRAVTGRVLAAANDTHTPLELDAQLSVN